MNNYIMVQKELISKGLKGNCLNLFLMMLDRKNLSEKNGWKDENGRTYIIMRVTEICKKLSVCKRTASSLLNNLEEAALITRKKQGLGKPNLIFITYQTAQCNSNIAQDSDNVNKNHKNSDEIYENYTNADDNSSSNNMSGNEFYMSWWDGFLSESYLQDISEHECEMTSDAENGSQYCDNGSDTGIEDKQDKAVPENHRKSMQFLKCRKLRFQKCKKLHHNNNINYNNTNSSVNNIINQSSDQMDDAKFKEYINTFKANIEYDLLMKSSKTPEILELINNTVTDTFRREDGNIRVAGKILRKSDVCRRLMQLDSQHAEYVIDCIQGTSAPIRSPRSYMLACLYNAPDTIDAYYMLQAKTDMNRQTYGMNVHV